jgi:hypothetical protein
MIDRVWIDDKISFLLPLAKQQLLHWSLFNPTKDFYGLLENGDDNDLEIALEMLSHHINLVHRPHIIYEWGLKMNPEVAGQIKMKNGFRSLIQIPLFYVGNSLALGAILAHEISHEIFTHLNLCSLSKEELEQHVDLISIVFGLGKIVLNGALTEMGYGTYEIQGLGYLSPEIKCYGYKMINHYQRISEEDAESLLTQKAIDLLNKQYSG